nr:PilZ domain-containing protein [Bacteroidota bacterium]
HGTEYTSNQPGNDNYPNDKRKHPRINTDLACHYSKDLQRLKSTITSGSVLNLSPEGVFVRKENCKTDAISVDDPITIKFMLAVNFCN